MSLMMASKDGRHVTREEAFRTDIIPVRTRTYTPVTNEEFVNMVHRVSEEHGLTLEDEQLGLSTKDMRMFGTYVVKGKDFFNNQIQMMLGIANSYDKSLTAKICWGQRVMVCSNLSFCAYGDDDSMKSVVGHRHTSKIFEGDGLNYRLNKSLELVDDFCRKQERFCEQLRDRSLTEDEAYATVVRSAKRGAIGKTSVVDICGLWDRQQNYPDTEQEYQENWHKEFMPRDAYSLFNCYTESNKSRIERNVVSASLDTLKVTSFFNKEFVLN